MEIRKYRRIKPGDRSGSLVVVKQIPSEKYQKVTKWLCQCDCGKETIVQGGHFRAGERVSCGCWNTGRKQQTGLKCVWHLYRRKANSRKIKFELSLEDLSKAVLKNCEYCGSPPENQIKTHDGDGIRLKYNGLARVDTNGTYNKNNVVPCCKHCNFSKGEMATEEWKNHIRKMYEFMGLGS